MIEVKEWKGKEEYNLTGKIVGSMLVIGFYGKSAADKSLWVVRCTCGNYELRSGKQLRRKIQEYNFCCLDCIADRKRKTKVIKAAVLWHQYVITE